MARLNTNAEIWSHLNTVYVLTDSTSGLSTTVDSTAAAVAATASTCGTTASSTTASTGGYIRVGPAGGAVVARIEATAVGGFTAYSQFGYALTDNWAVVELTQTDIGDIADDGVAVEVATDRTRIDVATQRHRYAWHVAHSDYICTIGMENLSVENLLVAMGIDEGNKHGAGTAADPWIGDWTPDNIDTITPIHFAAEGARKDGTLLRVEFWDVNLDPAATINLARGQDAPKQLAFSARHIRWVEPIG